MKIYLVADFKIDPRGIEYGYERIHLRTFHRELLDAVEHGIDGFCDEAGWYDGFLIEQKEEANYLFKGTRVFYALKEGKLEEIPAPKIFDDVLNLI